jgi:glycosyltransferase involved in cell wall biosynthesis
MKVLFCTNAFEKVTNGPVKFAHLLLNEANACGFEVEILTEDVSVATPKVHKLYFRIPKAFRLFSQFVRMWGYHKQAMKLRKEYPFDILVYNNAFIGLISCIFFKPTVGMINDYTNASHSFISVLQGKAKLNKRLLFHYIEYLTCKLSKRIIVNSLYLKNALQKHYHCDKSLFQILYKGIENDLVSLNRKEIIKQKETGSILFAKTDFVLGGLLTLIEALKNFAHDIKLYIVGPAEKDHTMLKELLVEANIQYEIISYLPPHELYLKMRNAEIFCVPSHLEAFGVANLEAMAMGCKIVSTNVGGIPEALGEERFAWLVEPGNPGLLREALTKARQTSTEDDMDAVSEHLHQFSSSFVVSRFKAILQACL